jgi:hypothetical protein
MNKTVAATPPPPDMACAATLPQHATCTTTPLLVPPDRRLRHRLNPPPRPHTGAVPPASASLPAPDAAASPSRYQHLPPPFPHPSPDECHYRGLLLLLVDTILGAPPQPLTHNGSNLALFDLVLSRPFGFREFVSFTFATVTAISVQQSFDLIPFPCTTLLPPTRT